MAASSAEQHECCWCCCGQAAAWRQSVWDRPIWSRCDIVVAFVMSHTTLDAWRAGPDDDPFPSPADLPGRLVRWSRDAVLAWFHRRHQRANSQAVAPPPAARHGETSDEGAAATDTPAGQAGRAQLPPIPRR